MSKYINYKKKYFNLTYQAYVQLAFWTEINFLASTPKEIARFHLQVYPITPMF
jgi:hypothetical protein